MFDESNTPARLVGEATPQLDNLEAAFAEPFAARVLEMARTYNDILQDSYPTDEEKNEIISELDYQWGTIKGAQMSITGMVRTLTYDGDEKQDIFLDGAVLTSNGFVIEDEPVYVGGQYLGVTPRVRHHLFIKALDVFPDAPEDKADVLLASTGDIDHSMIEFNSVSLERARSWLALSCPDLIDEIDERILNGAGGDDDAILSLRGLDFNEYADLSDEFTRNCLEVYLNNTIEIDTTAPYAAKLSGLIRPVSDESTLYRAEISGALTYISTLMIQPEFSEVESEGRWSLAAYTGVIPVTRQEQIEYYYIPVDAFEELKSIRSTYYSQ